MMEDTRFTEGMTYRTEGEIEEWLFDLQHWLASRPRAMLPMVTGL